MPDIPKVKALDAEAQARLDTSLRRFLEEQPGKKIRSLRWLTGQRRAYVLELKLDDGSRYFIKLGCTPRPLIRWFVAREYLHGLLVERTVPATDRSQVASMAGYHPEQIAFYVNELPGSRLDEVLIGLCRNDASPADLEQAKRLCRDAANWLLHFQQQLPYSDPEAPRDSAALLARVQRETAQLVHRSGGLFSRKQQERIDQKANQLLQSWPAEAMQLAPKHNDFAPWNVMATDDGVAVFDFANIRLDLRYYDAWYFFEALLSLAGKRQVSRRHMAECAEHFMQSYGGNHWKSDASYRYFQLLFLLNRMNAVVANKQVLPRRLLQRARLAPLLLQLRSLSNNERNAQ